MYIYREREREKERERERERGRQREKDLLLLEALDHLGAEIVDGLHLGGLERQLPALLAPPRRGLINL